MVWQLASTVLCATDAAGDGRAAVPVGTCMCFFICIMQHVKSSARSYTRIALGTCRKCAVGQV